MLKSLLFLLLTVPVLLGLSLTDHVRNELAASNVICMNDGFVFNDTCVCKEFTSSDDCGEYNCINFGRAFTGNCSFGCDCPSGFRGPHCEPVMCVSNFENRVKAFNPVIRTFSIVITFNDFMLNLPSDNITNALLQLVQPPFSTTIDQLRVQITGSSTFKCPNDVYPELPDCLKYEFEGYIRFGNTSIYSFTGADILNTLKKSSTNSALLIVTNIGLTDYLSLTEMELIQQTAVARQIEINVIVASQYNSFQSVFSDPAYKSLITLTEKTLGSFIAPYPLIGPPFKNSASEIITKFGKLIAAKTVVQASSVPNCAKSALYFNVFGNAIDVWDLYISIYLDNSFTTDFSPSVLSAVLQNLTLEVDAGNWKLFKTSYNSSVLHYMLMISSTYQSSCNYRIWTTSEKHLTVLPHTYLAYTQVDYSTENSLVDASSALPVTGVPNQVVAHIAHVPIQLQSNFSVTVTLSNQTFAGNAVSRDCLFNSYLTTVNCQNAGDSGTVHVQVSDFEFGFFDEVVPILCVHPENISKADTVDYNLAVCNGGTGGFVEEKAEMNEDELVCNGANTLGLDDSAPRTFALIYTNYNSLSTVLSQKLQNLSFFDVLRNYNKVYNFTSFASSNCTGQEPGLKISDNVATFVANIYADLSAPKSDPIISNSTNEVKCISTMVTDSNFQKFSDVIFITNQNLGNDTNLFELYKQLELTRTKLHFIVFDTNNYGNLDINPYYDLAARTAGSVIPISNKTDIENFFEFYGTQKRALSETVLSEYNPALFFKRYTTSSFYYNPNSSYYVMATVAGTPIPTITVNNETYNFIVIGTALGYFDIPQNFTEGPVSLTIFQYFYTQQMLINVFEIEAPQKYLVAFSTSLTVDADQAYPSFSGVGNLYVVAQVNNNEEPTITISQVPQKFVENGTMQIRNTTTCQFNDIFSNYAWQCTTANSIYYIRLDTPQATRTAVFTCYGNVEDLGCQNGGFRNTNGNCSCPPGFHGEYCDLTVCYNDGVPTDANTCQCIDLYEGPHCEIAKSTCYKQPKFPQYSSYVDTLILVVEGTTDIVNSLKEGINNIRDVYRQYVLAVYYNNDYNVQVFNNKDYLVDYFNNVTNITSYNSMDDIRIVLKAALFAAKTERSLLVWAANPEHFYCGDSDRADDELIGLVAKKRTELRAFSINSGNGGGTCFRSIALLGNGIPIFVDRTAVNSIISYINSITPQQPILKNHISSNLVVLDSYVTNQCFNNTIILIPQDSLGNDLFLTLSGSYTVELPSSSAIISPVIYKIPRGTESITLNCPGNRLSGYNLETLHTSRLAYTFGNSISYVDQGFAFSDDFDQSSLSFYLENIDDGPVDFVNFPAVELSSIDIEAYESSSYEFAQVIRPNCSYPWLAEIECKEGKPIKVRINNNKNNILAYQRVVTAYCLKSISCSVHATKLLNGGCACDPWWSGTDCTIPTCLNGGTANRESCSCVSGFYGDNCQFKASADQSAVVPDRNILVILDVITGPETGYFQFRQDLAREFVNTYASTPNAKFAFATNIDDSQSRLPLGSSATEVVNKINSLTGAELANKTLLSSALNYFNTQNFSASAPDGYAVSYIFYITHKTLSETDDYSAVAELAAKDVGIFTAYYANDPKTSPDTEILMSNALLGGITGSWTTYDIIVRFQNVLQSGASVVPSAPPSTTTPAPIPCVKNATFDVLFYVDISSNADLGNVLKVLLRDFANDINFDGTEDASRVTLGYAGQTPFTLCTTSQVVFENALKNIQFTSNDSPAATFDLNFNFNLPIMTNIALGARSVPRFIVYSSDKANITNVNNVTNIIQQAWNETNVAFIGLGSLFQEYTQIVHPQNLTFTLTEQNLNTVKTQFYNNICGIYRTYLNLNPSAVCS